MILIALLVLFFISALIGKIFLMSYAVGIIVNMIFLIFLTTTIEIE